MLICEGQLVGVAAGSRRAIRISIMLPKALIWFWLLELHSFVALHLYVAVKFPV